MGVSTVHVAIVQQSCFLNAVVHVVGATTVEIPVSRTYRQKGDPGL